MERIIEVIGELLPVGSIVTVDIGQNMIASAKGLKLKGDGRIFISGGFAAMGCSFPEAVGMSIALKKAPVYSIVGDGGLQMNIQELQTIVREKLPIVIFALNNSSLGLIKLFQDNNLNSNYIGTVDGYGYSAPSFSKIADAYGICSHIITDIDTLVSHKKSIESPIMPTLFEIII